MELGLQDKVVVVRAASHVTGAIIPMDGGAAAVI
jgi:hypothetical protein